MPAAVALEDVRAEYRAWLRQRRTVEARWAAEGLHLATDLGETTACPYPPVVAALRAVELGLQFGYPTCCVEEFALDLLHGRHPALRRGAVPSGRGGQYVPCAACCRELGREAPTDQPQPHPGGQVPQTHTITLKFADEDQAVGWFVAAQALGAIPDDAGLRAADALDFPGHRCPPGGLVVSSDRAAHRWLVKSENAHRAYRSLARERDAEGPDGCPLEPETAGG